MCSCGFDGAIVRPKRVHKQEMHILLRTLLVKQARMMPTERTVLRPLVTLGFTLGPLCGRFVYMVVTLGYFGTTVGSLWRHFGYMKVHFQNTHFPTYFNDFIKGMGEFGSDLGLLWNFFWHMRVTLGPFWDDFGITLGI